MHIPIVTGFYAGLLGLLLVFLTARVIMIRAQAKVALLDGGNKDLLVAIRRQGNFCELVPLCLILIAVAEMASSSIYLIHVLGIVLVVSRLIHPAGIDYEKGDSWQRVMGATGTLIVMLVASVWDIYLYLIRVALVSV